MKCGDPATAAAVTAPKTTAVTIRAASFFTKPPLLPPLPGTRPPRRATPRPGGTPRPPAPGLPARLTAARTLPFLRHLLVETLLAEELRHDLIEVPADRLH